MTDPPRLTGQPTPPRQALAHQHVLNAIARGRQTVREFPELRSRDRDKGLRAVADALLTQRGHLTEANQADLADAAGAGMGGGALDRLRLSERRVAELAEELRQVAELPGPLTEDFPAYSGIARVPLGVVGVVYEPQPAVAMLASAAILKAGNAVLLRGSPAAARTDATLVALLRAGLSDAGVPADSVQAISVADRATVRYLVGAYGLVDLVLVRAGLSLARQVRAEASVPLAELSHGICHIYLDATADPTLATQVVLESALDHPTRTGSAHTVLVHREAAGRSLPPLLTALRRAGVAVHGDEHVLALDGEVHPASDDTWRGEYLGLDLVVGVVETLDSAIELINQVGTGHTEVIVARDRAAVRTFGTRVSAASIAINTWTHPPELFITQRTHTRGPLNPAAFTTTKQITWSA